MHVKLFVSNFGLSRLINLSLTFVLTLVLSKVKLRILFSQHNSHVTHIKMLKIFNALCENSMTLTVIIFVRDPQLINVIDRGANISFIIR